MREKLRREKGEKQVGKEDGEERGGGRRNIGNKIILGWMHKDPSDIATAAQRWKTVTWTVTCRPTE